MILLYTSHRLIISLFPTTSFFIINMDKWFKIKKYPHIGEQLTIKDYGWVKTYVQNPEKIKNHSFCPFIHRTSKIKRFRKVYDNGILTSDNRKASIKKRELYYANHIDSMVFSYYSDLLLLEYEKILKKYNIENSVTAYRKIKKTNTGKGKCNIDFANEIFQYIKSNNEEHQIVIAFDIKSFFDNLSHKLIKESWCKVLNTTELPDDHHNVFKNITKFSFINENELFREFKNQIKVKRYSDNKNKKVIFKSKEIKKKRYLRKQNAVSFCDYKDLNTLREKGLIKSNKRTKNKIGGIYEIRRKGIPQGSPISANLANIYMLDFDIKFNQLISDFNGIYRRYSDDLIVVVNPKYKEKVINKIKELISELCELEIQDKKTQIFHFIKNNDNCFVCYQEFENNICTINRNLEYLGFQFDGESVLIKNSSLSSYYRKMKRSIKRRITYSKITKNQKNKDIIFENSLANKFTHIGVKNLRKKTNKNKYGNYISYVYKAYELINDKKIKNQVRNHYKIFKKTLPKRKVKRDTIPQSG